MRQSKYKNSLVFFIFLIFAFGFFGVTLNDFFLSDDFDFLFIAKNTKNVFSYFLTNYWGERSGGVYSPFLNLLFYFEYKIWHLNPLGYHLTNLLFHLGASFFVFLIGLELFTPRFAEFNQSAVEGFARRIKILPAFLAGFLFLIFPAHAEAVNWISARPHVVGTFFYLVCFWSYLKFRKSGKLKFIAIAFAAFIFSLFTKELALTLPFVILLVEIFNSFSLYGITREKPSRVSIVKAPLLSRPTQNFAEEIFHSRWIIVIFFVFSAVYILVRYLATGIFFGYYAQSSFILKVSQIFKNFVSGLLGLVSWGSARIFLTNLFLDYKILFLGLIFLMILSIWIKRKKWQILSWEFLIILILFVVPFVLILFLQFNLISDEGERYLYLPSAGFCLLVGYLLPNIFRRKIWLTIFSLAIIFYFSFFLVNKNLNWREASEISKKIVNDFGEIVDLKAENTGIVFFSLPDTYEGAHVFRNGIKLSVALYYPDYHPDIIIFVPVYLRLDKFNKNVKIINWEMGKNCDYIFGVSRAGNYELTGFDRQETENFIFELWGYNYSNYTSSAVKLKIKSGIGELMERQKVYFLMYDEGGLKEFKWCS